MSSPIALFVCDVLTELILTGYHTVNINWTSP